MMAIRKRTTIYFDPEIHRALRVKSTVLGRSNSDLVNEAARLYLAKDVEDLGAFEERAHEPNLSFEDVVRDLKQRGKI